MIVRLRELRSNEAICRYDNIKKKEDDPMSSLKDKTDVYKRQVFRLLVRYREVMRSSDGKTRVKQ